jgi:hypothetical protein
MISRLHQSDRQRKTYLEFHCSQYTQVHRSIEARIGRIMSTSTKKALRPPGTPPYTIHRSYTEFQNSLFEIRYSEYIFFERGLVTSVLRFLSISMSMSDAWSIWTSLIILECIVIRHWEEGPPLRCLSIVTGGDRCAQQRLLLPGTNQ